MRTRGRRGGNSFDAMSRLSIIAAAAAVVCCLTLSSAWADTSTRWYAPILLKTTPGADGAGNPYGNIEVVLQVTPATKPGPFEYVYWVTNNTTAAMSDFYFTCVGVDDINPPWFLPDGYQVLDGTRVVVNGVVTFNRGPDVGGWGNIRTGEQTVPYIRLANYYVPGTGEVVSSAKLRWSALTGCSGLSPGGSIGFSFTSEYLPSTVAKDLASGLAIRMFNGEVYAYGPAPEAPVVPEWSSVVLAMSGLGCLATLRRRFRK